MRMSFDEQHWHAEGAEFQRRNPRGRDGEIRPGKQLCRVARIEMEFDLWNR